MLSWIITVDGMNGNGSWGSNRNSTWAIIRTIYEYQFRRKGYRVCFRFEGFHCYFWHWLLWFLSGMDYD